MKHSDDTNVSYWQIMALFAALALGVLTAAYNHHAQRYAELAREQEDTVEVVNLAVRGVN